jgi:hypothetical protein
VQACLQGSERERERTRKREGEGERESGRAEFSFLCLKGAHTLFADQRERERK